MGTIGKQMQEYETRTLTHPELAHLFKDLVADWKQRHGISASILENRIPPDAALVPARYYVAGMQGNVIVPKVEIPSDFLGRPLAEVCNPAIDNCSFNTSEDDYWQV